MSDAEKKNFVTKIQVGHRIQIPEPYVIVLGLKEGDLVEVWIRKEAPKESPQETLSEENSNKT